MLSRFAAVFVLLNVMPALANELPPDEAKGVIVGKLWNFRCSEGTTGFGRIFANGSVRGAIKEPGSTLVGHVLPAGTVSMRPDSICASVPVGYSMLRPCFAFNKIDAHNVRGRVASPWWMRMLWGQRYCDFTVRDFRANLTGM
jgi:hypothetical protein